MKFCTIIAFLCTFLSKIAFARSTLVQYSIYSANISDHFDVDGNLRTETFSVRLDGPDPELHGTCTLAWRVENQYEGLFGNELLNCTDDRLSARLMREKVEGYTGWGLTLQYE